MKRIECLNILVNHENIYKKKYNNKNVSKTISVSLNFPYGFLEEILEVDFNKLKSYIELLAKQPPVRVHSYYEDKEIDYGEGHREVEIRASGKPISFLYTVEDSANVKGSPKRVDFVGRKNYTQQEVDELRS